MEFADELSDAVAPDAGDAAGRDPERAQASPLPAQATKSALEGRHYSRRASGGSSVVLVDEPAEPVAAADLAHQ
jgi:hypothetical protein